MRTPEKLETEIKFATDSAGLERVLNSLLCTPASSFQIQNLRTIYFDTPSADLGKRKIALRIREGSQKQNVLCFKSNSVANDNFFQRTEVEVTSPHLQPDISLFDWKTREALVRIIDNRPLEQQFEIQMKRQSVLIKNQRSEIEVSLDDGSMVIGEISFPLTEVELELKSGQEADLYDFATELARELPLRLDFTSKSEKAFRIRRGEKASPAKASPPELSCKATLDDAIAESISNALNHFVANWAALRESDDQESVHQMRVALRRMRSYLAMFKRHIPGADFESLDKEASRIADGLGLARACDVLRGLVEKVSLANSTAAADWEALLTVLQDRRNTAYSDALTLINDQQTTLFVLKVQRFLAHRAWRSVVSGPKRIQFFSPAEDFAVHALKKLKARALKRGALLPVASDGDLHKLRIALKKLRYGSELFSRQFDCNRKSKSYNRAISKLLNLLGAHNDFVGVKHLLHQLPQPLVPGAEKVTGFVLGWLASEDANCATKLLRSWKKFTRKKSYWD
jgi:triphosphatase